jgi:hypothetical protein
MPLAARVAHARLLLERWNFLARFPAKKWLILVDLRAKILMAVVPTAFDGWRWRIVGLKLRWPTKVAPFFRPDGEEKTLKNAGGLLYRRLETFLWWFGSFTRPEMGDRMRERESPARGERDSEIRYGVNARMAHRCIWRLWTVGSQLNWSCDCDWLDLQVDRTVRMGWVLIWCGAVYQELGRPGDVAQQDLRATCFKDWDVFEF